MQISLVFVLSLLFLGDTLVGKAALADTLDAEQVNEEHVYDEKRERKIPVAVSQPENNKDCTKQTPCSVAFVSAGYGVAHTRYRFLVDQLTNAGYLTIAVGHELPQDPPLSVTGDLYETRVENWQRGADTIVFLQKALQSQYDNYDFTKLLLVGHSNGGDISAWLANSNPELVKQVITLDHRRVPLPRNVNIPVLSVRASDFPADHGVLPSDTEKQQYPMCISTIPNARHNDMSDYGPETLHKTISNIINGFLVEQRC